MLLRFHLLYNCLKSKILSFFFYAPPLSLSYPTAYDFLIACESDAFLLCLLTPSPLLLFR